MMITLDERKAIFLGRSCPLPGLNIFVTRKLMRDLFATANLLVHHATHTLAITN